MKNNYLMIMIIMFAFLSCSKSENKKEIINNKVDKIIEPPKEEYPNIYTETPVTKKLGIIKYNPTTGGLVPGQTNIIQVLAKMIKQNPLASQLIIEYKKYMSSDYSTEIVVEYDRVSRKLTESRSSGAADIYENVSDNNILNLAKDPEISSLYMLKQMENANFIADNSKIKIDAIGPKPEQNTNDYSVPVVVDYLKNQFTNSKIEFSGWSKVSALGKDWIVRAEYTIIKSTGQSQTYNQWFFIQDSKVLRTKDKY